MQAQAQAQEWLTKAGLRITPSRSAVLAALPPLRGWVSHADIAATLGETLDRVTLYRTLDTLVEAGLVVRTVGEDRVGRFALAAEAGHDEHAHFNCADCGRVFCLPMPVPRRPHVPTGFAVLAVDLNVRGRCDACSATHTRSAT